MSYLSPLNLDREPFSMSPDPDFFYKSLGHYTALNRLEIAIRLKRGLSVILGDVGSGKTTLSRALLQSFNGEENEYVFHLLLNPTYKSAHQMLTHLAKLFSLKVESTSLLDYREAIEHYLYKKCVEEKKTLVLIIDEGQKLSLANLEVLRTLLNYETNEHKMLQLVIFGQMELLSKLRVLPNFMDRIGLKYILNPLNEYEIGQLIQFRLKRAGYNAEQPLFTYDAIRKIFKHTQGYPRQISLICHKAMEFLVMEELSCVTGEVLDRVLDSERVWNGR